MSRRLPIPVPILVLAATLSAGTAVAADPPLPPPPPGAGSAQNAASRADDMVLLLGLSPEQRPALDDFLGATMPLPRGGEDRDGDGDRDGGDRRSGGGDRSGPPAGGWMQARMEAAQRFRAALSPDQQMRFDALERLRRGTRRMGGQMGRRGRWGGGAPQ
jgi:Spy/CpxP family protein refolding chaperone